MEKAIAGKKENFARVADQVSEIERQISEIERAKQQIQTIIDKRVNMKATFNGCIELLGNKMPFFTNKQIEASSIISFGDFYTVFIAAYLSYAPFFSSKSNIN